MTCEEPVLITERTDFGAEQNQPERSGRKRLRLPVHQIDRMTPFPLDSLAIFNNPALAVFVAIDIREDQAECFHKELCKKGCCAMAAWHLQFRTLATAFGTKYRQTLGALSAGVGEFDEEHDDAPLLLDGAEEVPTRSPNLIVDT